MGATKADAPPRRGHRRLRRWAFVAFVAVVAVLLFRYARGIDWSEVLGALREYRAGTLAQAAALVALSYGLYGCFDLFGRALVGHRVPAPTTWAIGAVSYAFNLNVGALVGGVGMRVRLYTRYGLDAATTGRAVAVGVSTNWLGYLALAGAAFASGAVEPPQGWRIGTGTLRAVGAVMLVAFGAIVLACGLARRRTLTIRGHDFPVPTAPVALAQAAVSSANWLAMGTLMYVLLGGQVPLATTTAVLLVAAVAGVVTHVPAGLGVLEAVFLVLLADLVPRHELLAALLAYRAVYYLAPLLLAALAWPLLESRATRAPAAATAG